MMQDDDVKRPPLITMLVVLSVVSALLAFTLWRSQPADLFTRLNVTVSLINLMGMVGYWQMKRWGIAFCGIALFVSILYSMTLGIGWQGFLGAIGYAVSAAVGLLYVRDMR